MGLGFVGDLLGLGSTKYKSPDIFDAPGTKRSAVEINKMIVEMLQGSRPGAENPWLQDTFEEELSRFRGPAMVKQGSERERYLTRLNQMGIDPATQARLLADLERSQADQYYYGLSAINTGQARRKEEFPFKVLGLGGSWTANQQGQITSEARYKYEQDKARREQRAAAFRRLVAVAATVATGGAAAPLLLGVNAMDGGGGGTSGSSSFQPLLDWYDQNYTTNPNPGDESKGGPMDYTPVPEDQEW